MTKILLVEFNELCPALLQQWMGSGDLPNFRRFYQNSDVFLTAADEGEGLTLEPWIQWYSLHTGRPYKEHGVFHLTDGPKAVYPDVWSLLLDAGCSVWNCSSMNARGFARPGSAFLPDPWCTGESAHPLELQIFHDFIADMVQEYTNPAKPRNVTRLLRVAAFLLSHGLSADTIGRFARQLAQEAVDRGRTSWRRACLLDVLLRDVFVHYFKAYQPDFSTFFVNSTAHLQHAYWRHLEPAAFVNKPSRAEIEQYGQAIFFGYRAMDALLGSFLELERRYRVTLMFATALSQQPFLKYERTGGQRFHRPRDLTGLMRRLGAPAPINIAPVMTHQFLATFADAAARDAALRILGSLKLGDRAVFEFDHGHAPHELYFGSQINMATAADAEMVAHDGRALKFHDHFYLISETKSGRHHPDGCFWIKTGVHRVHRDRVSILDVLPTILARYGIVRPDLRGRDLLEDQRQSKAA
jgi:hypothetical protein